MGNIAEPARFFFLSHKSDCAPAKCGDAFRNYLEDQPQNGKNAALGNRVAAARGQVSILFRKSKWFSLLWCRVGDSQLNSSQARS